MLSGASEVHADGGRSPPIVRSLRNVLMRRETIPIDPAVELLDDKYEVLDVLGGGGMGRVYRARHRQLKRLVAIKLLNHDIGGPEAVKRFLREARAAARIQSPHIAHVMDAGVLANGRPYIVMEYLQGRDLASWIRTDGRLDVSCAVDFIVQALEALAEAHSLHIVHRDVKPDNLFATRNASRDTVIKVLDFGLAKAGPALGLSGSDLTERGMMLGTPKYMAPEQFSDAQQADVRSDIWSCGATLFELVTGVSPFNWTSLPQIYRAVMHRSIPTIRSLVPELPDALESVIATCLTRERELRYADTAELAAALRPWANPASCERIERIRRITTGAPVRQSDPFGVDDSNERSLELLALAPTPPVESRRRRVRWLALAVAAMVCAAALLWFARSNSSNQQRRVAAPAASVPRQPEPAPQAETSSNAIHAAPVRGAGLPDHPVEPPKERAVEPPSPRAPAPKRSKKAAGVGPLDTPADQKRELPTQPEDRHSVYENYP